MVALFLVILDSLMVKLPPFWYIAPPLVALLLVILDSLMVTLLLVAKIAPPRLVAVLAVKLEFSTTIWVPMAYILPPL